MAKHMPLTGYAPPVLPNGMFPHQMLSLDQFAALRGISKDTVRRLIKSGGLPSAKKVSQRKWGIPALELFK